MPTLQAGQTVSVQISEGEVYSVIPSGAAQVSSVGRSGNPLETPRTFSDARGFGPYLESGSLTIACVSGTLVYNRTSRNGIARIALMGDSIAAQNTDYASVKRANGPISWMLARLGQPWYLPRANNFAVGGTTCEVIRANQLPLVLSAHAASPMQRVFMSCGTNDTNTGRSLSAIKDDMAAMFDALLDAGITPVHHGILPRGNDGSLTNAKRQNMHLNEWLEWYAYTRGGLEFIDCSLAIANNASAFGNALTSLTDGTQLHPLDNGAFFMSEIMANYYRAKGIAPQIRFAANQADQYDATHNPWGVVFDSPNPLLQGGATAPTGMTCTGGTWACSTRTLSNGQTKPQINCTLAASTTHFIYDDAVATGGWDTENVREGDWLYGVCELELVNVTNLTSCALELVENNGVNTTTAADLSAGSGAIGATGSSLTLYTMTPPIQMRAYGGSGNASAFLRQRIINGSGETGTVRIKGFEMRKWIGEV